MTIAKHTFKPRADHAPVTQLLSNDERRRQRKHVAQAWARMHPKTQAPSRVVTPLRDIDRDCTYLRAKQDEPKRGPCEPAHVFAVGDRVRSKQNSTITFEIVAINGAFCDVVAWHKGKRVATHAGFPLDLFELLEPAAKAAPVDAAPPGWREDDGAISHSSGAWVRENRGAWCWGTNKLAKAQVSRAKPTRALAMCAALSVLIEQLGPSTFVAMCAGVQLVGLGDDCRDAEACAIAALEAHARAKS